MWSRAAQIALRAQVQHNRIRGAAATVLLVRWLEGAACWAIVYWFFSPVTVAARSVHLNFALYAFANLCLYFPHVRLGMTPLLVWLDLAVNLIPMSLAAHWSGGVYSPLLPIFVVKIGSYGLVYGVDVGIQSLVFTTALLLALTALASTGLVSMEDIERVPLVVRQRLTLTFAALLFVIGVTGAFRFFQILQDRETRIAAAVREKDDLYQASLQHQQQLRDLSRRIMQASENTMRRLARELHDDLGQALTAVKLDLGLIDRSLPAQSPLHAHVREAREQIATTLQNVRNLSQLLRPAVLDDLGLVPAMQSYIATFGERTGIAVALAAPPPEVRLPRPLELALYRVMQEALTNVVRHAAAQRVRVELALNGTAVRLEITDDGCGFDAEEFLRNPPAGHGMGVLGMRERVATYGGQINIESHPGMGTALKLAVPLTQPIEEPEDLDAQDPGLIG